MVFSRKTLIVRANKTNTLKVEGGIYGLAFRLGNLGVKPERTYDVRLSKRPLKGWRWVQLQLDASEYWWNGHRNVGFCDTEMYYLLDLRGEVGDLIVLNYRIHKEG